MEEIIRFENVSYNYTDKHNALSDINFSVHRGEIFSIIGSNGSGKTTLLHLLSGLLFARSGSVFYKDKQITEQSLKNEQFNKYFRESLGYVFQNPDAQLFCPTVFDELIFGPLQMGKDKDTAFARAESVMQMLNIDCLRDRQTHMLSGGEKKRVAIGAVLTLNPDVLVFDEPVSALDPKTRAFLIELIFQLNEAGKTIIITTHHLELVDHLQSRVAVLSENHTIEKTGSTGEILSDTDLLIRTNLIGEHPHRHGSLTHKHLSGGFLFHKH
ncbi:MAG: ABC transporter ATP-binding protein [Bacteroidota bacterium]|nr:ABC transporter ATP-binding protein [Bacteroidota bacterium]